MAGLMYKRAKIDEYLDTRQLPTRLHDKIIMRTPVPRTNKLSGAPIYLGSKLWDNLPGSLQQTETYCSFKNKLKQCAEILVLVNIIKVK